MPSGEVAQRQSERRVHSLVGWLHKRIGEVGPCPTLDEIAQSQGLQTKAGASRLLQRAESLGVISREGRSTSKAKRSMIAIRLAVLSPVPAEEPGPDVTPAAEFRMWLRDAKRGDQHVYFTGHLAEERGRPPGARDDAALLAAAMATGAADDGVVVLINRRIDGEMAYVAVRTGKPLRNRA